MPRKGEEPKTHRPLNARQEAFVHQYTGPCRGNATKAAKAAGYNGDAAALAAVGAKLLRNPKVAEQIETIRKAGRKRAIATSLDVQEFLTRIVNDDPELTENELEFDVGGNPVIDPRKLDEVARAAIVEHERQLGLDEQVEMGGIRVRRRRSAHLSLPPGLDVFFRRRLKASERRAAAMDLLRSRGLLIDNVLVKREESVEEVLKGCQKHMDAAAFSQLLVALTKRKAG